MYCFMIIWYYINNILISIILFGTRLWQLFTEFGIVAGRAFYNSYSITIWVDGDSLDLSMFQNVYDKVVCCSLNFITSILNTSRGWYSMVGLEISQVVGQK